MQRQCKAEVEFRAKYPHANVRPAHGDASLFTVYAGDYICSTGGTVAGAFAQALKWDKEGLITPDPDEQRGDFDLALGLSTDSSALRKAILLVDQYRAASAAIRIVCPD